MRLYKCFLFSLLTLALSMPTYAVVITEIHYDPADSGDIPGSFREFIEVYNPTSEAIDLSGYVFTEGIEFTFPNGATLDAGAYAIVARVPSDPTWSRARYPVFGPYEGKLSNDGERVELRRPDGARVDRVRYDVDFPWPRGADGYGPSLERIHWELPADDFHSWRSSLTEDGTPGAENSVAHVPARPFVQSVDVIPPYPTSADDVQIRVGIDTPEEIENVYLRWEANKDTPIQGLVNANNTWRYWKGRSSPSTESEWTTTSFDDSAWATGTGGFGYGDLDQVETTLSDMRNNYSTLYIRNTFRIDNPDALGNLSLRIFFDDGFICFINGTEVARHFAPQDWTHRATATGSHESDQAELYTLGDASEFLRPGENVIALVGFNISQNNSSDFVLAPTLIASAINESDSQIQMSYLADWGDRVIYEGTIPAQPSQTLVRYAIQVERTDGQTIPHPFTSEPRPFESYFVSDREIPAALPILWMFPDRVTNLHGRSEPYSALVVQPVGNVPPQVFDGVTIRSSRNGQKIRNLKGEEFRVDRTINLSLESPREGTTAGPQSPHVEEISYDFFSQFGVLTPRCDWYRVIVNNEHSQRIAVQQPNERFLDIHGRNADGNIYKIAYNEPGGFSKQTNQDEGVEDYIELFDQVTMRNRTNLEEAILTEMDYERVMGYNLATFLLSHWDGIKNNIFLYHDLQPGGKWEVIPWDVDKTFGYTDSNPMYWQMPIDFFNTLEAPGSPELTGRDLDGPIIRPFHSIPSFHQDFVNRVAESLDGRFSLEHVGGMIQQRETLLLQDLDLIEAHTGTTNTGRRNQITESYDTMRFFLEQRHAFLLTQVPADFTVERSVPVNEYHSGEVLSSIRIRIVPLSGKTISAQVTERVPTEFDILSFEASHGTVSESGGVLTWNTGPLSEPGEMQYSLLVPEADVPPFLTLAGEVALGDVVYSIAETQLRYLPDNVRLPDAEWVLGSGATWTIVDGVLNAYAEDAQDPKHAWIELDMGTDDYTVQADVRMLDWVDDDLARAGVAVRVDPSDGDRALNLLYHDDHESVDMLSDRLAWGPRGDYAWETGEWHTMTLTIEGDELTGQIARTDSNTTPMVLDWGGFPVEARSSGYPGLTASTLDGLTAQFDNFIVIADGQVVFFDDFEPETHVPHWSIY